MLNTTSLKKNVNKKSLNREYMEATQDSKFVLLVKKLHLSEEEASKVTTRLEKTVEELEHCSHCKGIYECKNELEGHVAMPVKKEGQLYFSYAPCKYVLQEKKLKSLKKTGQKELDMARMKDIDYSDKKRIKVIKWLDNFYENYDLQKCSKGLYLHGNFGSGKTFLISALLHELKIKKHAQIVIVYFPELLRNLKENWDIFEYKIKEFQQVDLLLIDDIGAEKVTEWGRDEVLGTILQYRMEFALPTFFTSNLTLEELETHLKVAGNTVDSVKARRIIERIKQVSENMELISENKRK